LSAPGSEAAPHRPPALALALGLDALAVALFVGFVAVVPRAGSQDSSDDGFFADPLPAVLIVLAATAVVAAGVVAAVSLVRAPLRSRAGRWAMRLAVFNALLMPAVGVSVTTIAWILGYDLPEGWGEPVAPVWLLSGLAALAFGARAKDPGRRGLLVLPLVIGAAVLSFSLGEILSPH
jgi:uncharacterized protein (DUF983 family)